MAYATGKEEEEEEEDEKREQPLHYKVEIREIKKA